MFLFDFESRINNVHVCRERVKICRIVKKKKKGAFDYILNGVTKYSLIVSSASFEIYLRLELTSVI